eukprot:361222-Chlamydomonas_euryale.AAC.2
MWFIGLAQRCCSNHISNARLECCALIWQSAATPISRLTSAVGLETRLMGGPTVDRPATLCRYSFESSSNEMLPPKHAALEAETG